MVRNILWSFLLLVCLSSTALAQETVPVRVAPHDDYARIVFDWPSSVTYQVDRAGDNITINFAKAGLIDLLGADLSAISNVQSIRQENVSGSNLQVVVTIPKGSDYRHFSLGQRIVVDVYNPAGASKQAVSGSVVPSAPKTETPAPVTVVHDAAMPEEKLSSKEDATSSEVKGQAKPVKKAKTVIEEATDDFEAHVITLSLTDAVGAAVFERGGALWIVLDRSDVSVLPQVAGPHKDDFPSFRRYKLTGGTAFRMVLPPAVNGQNIYAEGGGLVWRVVVSPNERDTDAVAPQHSFTQNQQARGGTILWPLEYTTRLMDVYDPTVGDTLKVVTVERSDQFAGPARSYVDFNTFTSPAGLVIEPNVDDLVIELQVDGVHISRPDGLAMSRDKDINLRIMRENVGNIDLASPDGNSSMRRIFDFDRWMMGGVQVLRDNQHILLSTIGSKDKPERVQDLLTLAKMNVANNRGQEAIGFLELAAGEMPDLEKGPEFLALRGAAYAIAGQHEKAFMDLATPALRPYGELDYWRAYALAWLEDWQQARKILPEDFSLLVGYPLPLLETVGLKLAEVSLRGGDVSTAQRVLSVLQREKEDLALWTISGMNYLEAESLRQSEKYEEARKIWYGLSKGEDDLYRAKAGLAMTMLERQEDMVSLEKAIDRLEGLRYLWRGDELEAQINFILGSLYIEQKEYLKGLTILRDAAGMSPRSDIGKEIALFMSDKFDELLLHDADLSALDAVTIYEEFRELTPTGAEGNRLVQKLAERLVDADLLGRASGILQHQVDYRLDGVEKGRVAVRLATIYILDRSPTKALAALKTAYDVFSQRDDAESKARLHDIELLKARAFSDGNRTKEALALLDKFEPSPDVNKLRADISWQAGLWEDASDALDDLILDEGIATGADLTPSQADLILHRTIALNLAGDRIELSNMRKRYGDAMKKTSRARLFDVVTRPRKNTLLADRETLSSLVNEVDIFKDFLNSYRESDKISN